MIETIFRVIIILVIISVVLAVLGSFSINYGISFEFGELLLSFLHCVCYIVPFKKLLPIFVCVVGFVIFKISVSILKTLWAIFPLKG